MDGYNRTTSRSRLLIGFYAVTARLRHDAKSIGEIYFEANCRDRRMQDSLKAAEAAGVCLTPADADRLRGIAGTDRHQGVVAKAGSLSLAFNPNELLGDIEGTLLLLVLDGMTDPHNLGACLRVADAAGVHAVIAPKDCSVGINMAVAKATSGVAETAPYIIVTNLARTLHELQERGTRVIGMADRVEQDLYQVDFKGLTAIVAGAEGEGIRRPTREIYDVLVSIPVVGNMESLNVSVASDVCLFEAVCQRVAVPVKK